MLISHLCILNELLCEHIYVVFLESVRAIEQTLHTGMGTLFFKFWVSKHVLPFAILVTQPFLHDGRRNTEFLPPQATGASSRILRYYSMTLRSRHWNKSRRILEDVGSRVPLKWIVPSKKMNKIEREAKMRVLGEKNLSSLFPFLFSSLYHSLKMK